jgi:hypothetical protein
MDIEITRIQTLFEDTIHGDNWTGINLQQALQGIDATIATKRIHQQHLNIAELTSHLTCWNLVIAKRLDAENELPTPEEDFPVIHQLTEEEWQKIQNDAQISFNILIDKLSKKLDDILDKPMFDGATSAYRNLHGQISHLHYHIGQIVLLKKIV